MCAIIDADVVAEVFGRKRTEAGIQFRNWLDSGQGKLIVGGKNLTELAKNGNFGRWFAEERRRGGGRVHQVRNKMIRERQEMLVRDGVRKSNDEHVLALALVSGARFLYSNDRKLKNDFRNMEIISEPGGMIYTTHQSKKFTEEHRALLQTENLCSGTLPN